ncbi:MAG TPA: glycogen debranching N-terminal domain-containing protein [Streptosporangiaceae bacterium]|nr:glycogen debranching N-terminal domain-containing protein [Streptosporangiaceae bacterium]
MQDEGQPWLHDLITVLSAPTMALSEQSGQMRRSGAQGVMHAHSRVLSEAVLEIDGAQPAPTRSGLLSASTALFASIPRQTAGDSVDPAVWLERRRTVSVGTVDEVVRVTGGTRAHGTTRVTLRVAADLAVLADIKSGRTCPPVVITAGSGLEWGEGPLRVQLNGPGAVATVIDDGEAQLTWWVKLSGGSVDEIRWRLTVHDATAVVTAPPVARVSRIWLPKPRSGQQSPPSGSAQRGDPPAMTHGGRPWEHVRADCADSRLPRLLARSIDDAAALRMMTTLAPGEVFLGAGTPWFLTLFGRDSIWAARLLLPFGWQLASGTLRALAAFQGKRVDRQTGEAPGKIPHELRPTSREAAHADDLPGLYYGTIDATPLWVCLLHDAWRWGMPAAEVRALLPCLNGALAWMRDHGDADGDGLLEYRDSGSGLANQGWKDSHDAIRFPDGRTASPPVTLCEVQGYAYQAAIAGADLLEAFNEPGSGQWRAWAGRLAEAFRSSFWVTGADGTYPALALDGTKRKVDALASNIAHLLGTGLLTVEEESRIAERLSRPDMNSGFGLRTMSSASGGYSPLSYHCGSVWSHDTAIAISGLVRSGHHTAAASLVDGLLEAAAAFDWRLPELFSGHARAQIPWPLPYPASCRPQAWAAAASGALVQAILGLDVDVPAAAVRMTPPRLDSRLSLTPLRVDGLVAGHETFSAGIDAEGSGYVDGLSLALVSR